MTHPSSSSPAADSNATPSSTPEQMKLDVPMSTSASSDDELTKDEPVQTSELTLEPTEDAWVAAPVPGTVATADQEMTAEEASAGARDVDRETELLTLIHDLNECNDVLLSQIAQLESALADSQQQRQNDIERAQQAYRQVVEQANTQQEVAAQATQTAQHQIAQLVAKVDETESRSHRQQVKIETLETELSDSQERINQLEHDCAVTSQQHADEVQARLQAEKESRDLRSRLQRQQRYTIQFKAALEKSLTVTPQSVDASADTAVVAADAPSDPLSPSGGVPMPKARRITPWASAHQSVPFEGIDPHLENLIRSANHSVRRASTPSDAIPPISVGDSSHLTDALTGPTAKFETAQPEATQLEPATLDATTATTAGTSQNSHPSESSAADSREGNVEEVATSRLLEGLSKVMDSAEIESAETTVTEGQSAKCESDEADSADSAATDIAANDEDDSRKEDDSKGEVSAESSSPRFDWRSAADGSPSDMLSEPPHHRSLETPVAMPAVAQAAETDVAFTEPSPWEQPSHDAETDVEPVVNQLRNQKKVRSLSSVQLPTFSQVKAGSFKR